jgi:hypothetical protein
MNLLYPSSFDEGVLGGQFKRWPLWIEQFVVAGFGRFLTESLILAQDERWRRA